MIFAGPSRARLDIPGEQHVGVVRGALVARAVAVVDLATLSTVAVFAAWTVWYLLALGDAVPSAVAFWAWVACTPGVVMVILAWLRRPLDGVPHAAPWVPLVLAVGAAVASSIIVRPDLDDASYVVRSTWIAAHGDVRVGDVIFSGGSWGGLPAQTPYLSSIEALVGWLARVGGVSAGSVVYLLVSPIGSFLSVWALGMVFRAWGARRVALCLSLASVFLLMGGATPASWGMSASPACGKARSSSSRCSCHCCTR